MTSFSFSNFRKATALSFAGCLLAAGVPSVAAEPAALPDAATLQVELVRQSGGEIYTFYAERGYRPLWLDSRGIPDAGASALLNLLESAEYDGIAPEVLGVPALRQALAMAATSPTRPNISRAELALSRAFVTYVEQLRAFGRAGTIYESNTLRPQPFPAYHLLKAAEASQAGYVAQMGWMHPLYAPLRRSLGPATPADVRQVAIANLHRIREIPVAQRQVIVDIANARLWMYEDGRPVDSMKVVVGKTTSRTPLLAGYIRYAIVNPYWNVPAELVSRTIANNVLRRGVGYLKTSGYEVLADWSANPAPVDPARVDWKAAARGNLDLRVRQLPRPGNAMGRVKFEFPNQFDIYLHDTPDKNLMALDARQFSMGCIRLEDAERLGRWLMQGQTLPQSPEPETKVDLPRPVPIYLTYLTAHVDQGAIALGPDPYGVDAPGAHSLAMQ